jgi:hypothetical protein
MDVACWIASKQTITSHAGRKISVVDEFAPNLWGLLMKIAFNVTECGYLVTIFPIGDRWHVNQYSKSLLLRAHAEFATLVEARAHRRELFKFHRQIAKEFAKRAAGKRRRA